MLISHIILLNNFKLNRLFSHASDCICYFILNVIFSDLVECIMTYRNNFACNIISAGICCMNIGFKISFLSDLYRNISCTCYSCTVFKPRICRVCISWIPSRIRTVYRNLNTFRFSKWSRIGSIIIDCNFCSSRTIIINSLDIADCHSDTAKRCN